MRTIGELCERDVVVATPDMTVAAAAKLMRHRHVGCLVIVDRDPGLGHPLGIVTDRDIVVEVTANDLDARELTVGDVMTEKPVTVRADEGPIETMHRMQSKGVRRLPVVNQDGRLIGLVTLDDLLEVVAEQLQTLRHAVVREQTQEAVGRR